MPIIGSRSETAKAASNNKTRGEAFRVARRRHREPVIQELFDITEVARRWGTSRRFIELEIERGRLAAIRLSTRMIKVSKKVLEDYEAAHTVGSK